MLRRGDGCALRGCAQMGWVPLHMAVLYGILGAVRLLLEHGVNTDATCKVRAPALCCVVALLCAAAANCRRLARAHDERAGGATRIAVHATRCW